MVFGTFDVIHPGHEDFFRQARALSDDPILIVSLARDSSVHRIKGARALSNEQARLEAMRNHPLIDDAVLGDEVGYLDHIEKIRPDIIALGYDQFGEYVEDLERDLVSRGLMTKIIRLNAFEPERYKTSKLRGK